MLEWVLAGDLERLVESDLGAAEEAGRLSGGGGCQEGGGDREELHLGCGNLMIVWYGSWCGEGSVYRQQVGGVYLHVARSSSHA